MRQFSNIAANQIIPKDREGGREGGEGGERVGEKRAKAHHQRWNEHGGRPAATWPPSARSFGEAPPGPALPSATSLPAGSRICAALRAKAAMGSGSEGAHPSARKEAALMVPQWM